MPPRSPRDKNKYPWPYVKAPPLGPKPLVGLPSPAEINRRRRRVTKVKAPPTLEQASDDFDERLMTQMITEALAEVPPEPQLEEEALATPADPVAPIVVPSDSSEDEAVDPKMKKVLAKIKRSRVNTFNLYFNEPHSGNTAAMA